jgi:nucleoid-associated protein YgaU
MYQNSITELPRLKNFEYQKIFKVHVDSNNRYYYNLIQNLVIPSNLPEGYYNDYSVVYGDTWPFISFKNYQNPGLWWIITEVNNIINPTIQPEPGTIIKILKNNFVTAIVGELATTEL